MASTGAPSFSTRARSGSSTTRACCSSSRSWAGRRDAVVVVVSEGPGADWLDAHGADEPALRLLPYQPYERLPEVLASADVLVAVLEPEAGVFSTPSKVLTYLCAARPLLASVPGDNLAARVVERSGGGHRRAAAATCALFSHAAEALSGDADRRRELSQHGRAYAETAFDIDAIAARFEEVLERAGALGARASALPVLHHAVSDEGRRRRQEDREER